MDQLVDAASNLAAYIAKALWMEGIDHVFMVPGYMIEPFLPQFTVVGITPVVACHEGGAAFMADGYARATGKFGVAMGIGGPGVTNMMTAICSAYSDRSPVLVISGSLPFSWEGNGAFQDSSPTGIADRDVLLPATVFAEQVPDPSLAGAFLRKAIKAMKGVENRPAFLSIPQNMQLLDQVFDYLPTAGDSPPRILEAETALPILELLATSTHVAILAGNGSVWSGARDAIQRFAKEYGVPVVTTLRAKGVIPEDDANAMGVFGVGGSLWANQVIMGDPEAEVPKAEVLLVLGATLNENNTHGWMTDFVPSRALVRVDVNPNNVLGREYKELLITGDAMTFMEWLISNRPQYDSRLKATKAARERRLNAIRSTPYYEADEDRTSDAVPINPARAIADLRQVAPRNTVLTVDSGAHTFFAGHHWQSYGANEFLLLSTIGPMGYGIAMAVGAMMARPTRPHCVVVGDGSLLMHGIEIHTAARYKLPLVIVVINNSALGNVYLRALNEGTEAVRLSEIPTRDWAAFAKSLGGDGVIVEEASDLIAAYQRAFATTDRPFLIDVRCDKNCRTPNTQEGA